MMLLLLLLYLPCIIAHTEYWNTPFSEGESLFNNKAVFEGQQFEVCHDLEIDSQAKNKHIIKVFTKCKRKLASKLLNSCKDTKLKKAGELVYSTQDREPRTRLKCCVKNHTCYKDYSEIGNEWHIDAERYLTDTAGFLEDKVKYEGYHTCHPITNRDASVCHEDCKSFEASSNIKDVCSSKGGQFKCCIRRHTAHCGECQYCCTIPICTWISKADMHQKTITDIKASSRTNKTDMFQAQHSIWSLAGFFMADDTRCLKPDENVEPRQWETYVPEAFMAATTKKDMAQLRTIPHDERFFNFEDRNVFLAMTGDDYQRQWKETYGYDFVAKTTYESPTLPCAIACMQEEYGRFATKCKKKRGIFKCCVTRFNLKIFEKTRQRLYDMGLVNSTTNVCSTKTDSELGNCVFCTATYSCTIPANSLSTMGLPKVEFLTPFNKTIGGRIIKRNDPDYSKIRDIKGQNIVFNNYLRPGLRYSFCVNLDFCNINFTQPYYDLSEFVEAKSWEEFCRMKTKPLSYDVSASVPTSMEQIACKKRKSNVKICSKTELEKKSEKVKAINLKLEKVRKEIKRKGKKRKKRKRKRKRKRKKGKKKRRRKKKN